MINPAEPYYYEYCEGGKTGYTMKANNTLMTFAKKDGLELICVIMDCDGAKYAYSDTKALYNYCYNNYVYYYPLSDFSFESTEENATDQNVILNNYYSSLDHDMIDLSVDKDYALLLNKSVDTTQIEKTVTFYDEAKDDQLGEITFAYDGEQIGSTPITSTTPSLSSQMSQEKETKPTTSIWKTIGKIALRIGIVIGALLVVLIIYLIFAAIVRNVKRNRRRRGYRRRSRRRKDDDYYF